MFGRWSETADYRYSGYPTDLAELVKRTSGKYGLFQALLKASADITSFCAGLILASMPP